MREDVGLRVSLHGYHMVYAGVVMLRFARAMAALIPLLGARIALADDDGTKAPEAKPRIP